MHPDLTPEPNDTETNFTSKEWDEYLLVAFLVQETDPRTVDLALQLYWHAASECGEYAGEGWQTAPMLLFRLVFHLPSTPFERRGQRSHVRPFDGLHGHVRGGTESFSLSLPVGWKDGRPHLVAWFWKNGNARAVSPWKVWRAYLRHFEYRDEPARLVDRRDKKFQTLIDEGLLEPEERR